MLIKLSSGDKMPVLGLGTWQASPDVVEKSVLAAFSAGYRLVDTAYNYGNEAAIGSAVKSWIASGGKREDIFITTKLPNFGIRASDVEKYLTESLQKLDMDYVDLYLIHHPFGFLAPPPGTEPPMLDLDTDHLSTWKALEAQVALGRCRNIGLSNFNEQQLRKIWEAAAIKPANLQVELHAYLQQPALVDACHSLGVTITAYAPLASPQARTHFKHKYGVEVAETDLLSDPIVLQISQRIGATPAQVLLRFLIDLEIAIIPKSASPERIITNYKSLETVLTQDDIAALKKLDRGESGRIFDFLFYKGVENHPEYPFPLTTCKHTV